MLINAFYKAVQYYSLEYSMYINIRFIRIAIAYSKTHLKYFCDILIRMHFYLLTNNSNPDGNSKNEYEYALSNLEF